MISIEHSPYKSKHNLHNDIIQNRLFTIFTYSQLDHFFVSPKHLCHPVRLTKQQSID